MNQGRKHGYGTLTQLDTGAVTRGNFINDRLYDDEKCHIMLKDVFEYRGQALNGMKEGHGTITYFNNSFNALN